ncbi:MAG: 2Fe-2S iron-sulfur cluster binding domain-containing protein [Myxococcales bacterium]|nr:2Fe-2S iron-sulfur cluster binding domain-containing protein [Myxococcales bacterium]
MPKISFEHDHKTAEANVDDWLYDVCTDAGASVPFSCKAGACGTCATEVLGAHDGLGRLTQRELRTLETAGLDPARYRLPCLHSVAGDIVFGGPAKGGAAAAALPVVKAQVESFRRLNLSVAEVRFFVQSPGFAFLPGQYMVFQIPSADGREVIRRSYSISTPPSDAQHFEICVRAVAGGHGSNWVHRLRPGQLVSCEGPVGDFVLADSDRDIVMVATGTGASPIKSMLLHLLDTRSSRRVRLFFGVRSHQDLFYTDLLRGLEAHYPSFSSDIILSSPDPAQWAGARGRVTDLVEKKVRPADAATTEAYLCGSRSMIEDVSAILRSKGFADDRIHFENFF